MRRGLARLLVVLGAASSLWLITPGTASAASGCGGASYRGAPESVIPDESPCNNDASNGAKVVTGLGAAFALGLGYRAYRRGSRAEPPAAPTASGPAGPERADSWFAALKDYSGPGYDTINRFLRAPSRFPGRQRGLQAHADNVSAALAKLPRYEGTTYRGVDYEPWLLNRYQPGRIVTERGFTSTSVAPRVALRNFEGNVTMTVTGRTGHNIVDFAAHPHEVEVLYDKGTRFKVLSKRWNPTVGMWFINMVEVP